VRDSAVDRKKKIKGILRKEDVGILMERNASNWVHYKVCSVVGDGPPDLHTIIWLVHLTARGSLVGTCT